MRFLKEREDSGNNISKYGDQKNENLSYRVVKPSKDSKQMHHHTIDFISKSISPSLNKSAERRDSKQPTIKSKKHSRVKTSLPVSLISSPYTSKGKKKKEDAQLYNITDQDRMVMKMMKTPIHHNSEYTLDYKRESSLDNASNSFHYPSTNKRMMTYKGISSSKNDLKPVKMNFINKSQKTSFIEDYQNEMKDKTSPNDEPSRLTKHTRHRSDGYKVPTNYTSNYSKYIKNPKKTGKSSKNKQRAGSRDDSEDSNLISSVHILNSKRPSYFGKKFSYVSEVNKTVSKRSPSITILKKRRIGKNTAGNNSPVLSSTESLHKKSKSKPKHRRHLTKLSGFASEKNITFQYDRNASKAIVFKRKKKPIVSSYKKGYSYSKPVSPHSRMAKSKSKTGNMTKQVSTRRTSINAEDLMIIEPKRKSNIMVSDETIAQIPSEMNVKRSFCDNRQLKDVQSNSGSKSNVDLYKDIHSKHNATKSELIGVGSQKKVDFSKLIDSSKSQAFKNTQFIIPMNLSRKQSIEKDNLTKYLKESHNVQSHSIHISELLNHSGKSAFPASFKKSPPISAVSSITRPEGHKRVKSHYLINQVPEYKSALGKYSKDGLLYKNDISKAPKTSQSTYHDINLNDKFGLKKHHPYMMKKNSKKAFSKKNSFSSNNKYTVLKSKKHIQGYIQGKHKSFNVTPKKNKLHDYQYTLQQVTNAEKSKITMNVSIDLSQNQNHNFIVNSNNVVFIDKKESSSITNSRRHSKESSMQNVKRSDDTSPIIEEDDDFEHTTSKVKSKSKISSRKNSQKVMVEEYKKITSHKDFKLLPTKESKASSLANQLSKISKNDSNKIEQKFQKHYVNALQKELPQSNRYKKLSEEQKYFETQEVSSIEEDKDRFPEIPSERKNISGCVPSIPSKHEERLETDGTDISALNLSPKSKTAMKLKKLIKTSFKKTGKAPDSTSEFYRIGKVLGRGAFGKVSLTVHRLSEEMVAIKSINKEYLTDDSSRQKVMKEVKILKKMRHKNIIQLLDTFETSKHIIFVMELCSGGDLLNYVRKRRKLTEDYAKAIFKQILEALHYCHKLNILHRDIKLDNIILDSEGVIKVGDFGVSKIVESKQTMYDQCGTPAYIAPEILRDKGYKGFGIDVWSAGVVLYAMLYGTVPFRAQNMSELHDMIVKAKYSLKAEISEPARDLIKKILEPDPRKRLTIPQILSHPWFSD